MIATQIHRGPDGSGFQTDVIGDLTVALGHCRLSIIDLSDNGLQPMRSACGNYSILFNGEIYNYLEIRSDLESHGCTFVSSSDTEVALQALKFWGAAAFSRFNGMWAIAFLDLRKRSLILSRDRFGVKPLYWYRQSSYVLFSSEIKAICIAAGTRFGLNLPMVARYLTTGLLDTTNETLLEGVRQVPAGSYAELNLNGDRALVLPEPTPFWTLPTTSSLNMCGARHADELRELFLDAVRIRLRSDVPVGVLLSGGVDSSAIAAAMHAVSPHANIYVISSAADDPRYSEWAFIDRMAAHIRRPVQRITLRFAPSDVLDLLAQTSWHNDEPIGSFSTMAHYLLMQRARELGVTVLLSGQGADEILCGYKKFVFFYIQRLLKDRRLSLATRTLVESFTTGAISEQMAIAEAKRYLPSALRPRTAVLGRALADVPHRIATGLGTNSIPERQRRDLYELSVPTLVHYEDRMSMAASREIRLPFLDYRLVSALLPLPAEYKLRHGWTKWIFRRAMQPLMPPEIAWRRDKQGFLTPGDDWLRNPLRPSLTKLFRSDMLIGSANLIDQDRLRSLYETYCTGRNPLISAKDVFHPLALEIWARSFAPYLRMP